MRYMTIGFLFLSVVLAGHAQDAGGWDTYSDTWAATDGLGRVVVEHDVTGGLRPEKTVGVFYYIWHGQHGTALHDITKIREANPENPAWGPVGIFHHWGEPLYGYYIADDAYVIRKNAQMLADAGVDVIFFDVTNAFPYTSVYLKLCQIYTEIRAQGGRTPQIAFLTNSASGQTVQSVYDNLYAKGLYKDLWFHWDGKPLILAKTEEMTPETLDFFTVRRSWAWDPGKDKWPWLERYPQKGGWHDSPEKIEQMVVETAEHPIGHNDGLGLGKSFRNNVQPKPGFYESEQGYYFAAQWEQALKINPAFVFITQWNEWIAQRFLAEADQVFAGQPIKKGDTFFVDVYSMEFNRDIEPMQGGYQDNYYYQMVDGIRRFKGTRPLPPASAVQTIALEDFQAWADVQPEYRDDRGDLSSRDHKGYGDLHFTNQGGLHDLLKAKIARDAQNLYFYIETVDALQPIEATNWMRLFLSIEGREGPVWETWQYLVQPQRAAADSPLTLYCSEGGWQWQALADVDWAMEGNRMALRIPRSLLGLGGADPVAIRFKWADGMQDPSPLDWILHGDTAPNGRFQYRYRAEEASAVPPTP